MHRADRPRLRSTAENPCPLADPSTTPLVSEQHPAIWAAPPIRPDGAPPTLSDGENSRPGRKRPSRCKFLTSIARQHRKRMEHARNCGTFRHCAEGFRPERPRVRYSPARARSRRGSVDRDSLLRDQQSERSGCAGEVEQLIARVTERGFLTRACVAVVAPVPSWLPPLPLDG